MDLLLNTDVWTVINKWSEGIASNTYHQYPLSVTRAIKHGYLGLLKTKLINSVTIDNIHNAITYNQFEILQWLFERYPSKYDLPFCMWSKLQSREITELVFSRINLNKYDYMTSHRIIDMICEKNSMIVVNYLHDQRCRIDVDHLREKLNTYFDERLHYRVFSFEKFDFLYKHYPKAIVPNIILRLEDTPDVDIFLKDPVIRKKIMDKPNDTECHPCTYRVDIVNLQILKMYYKRYPVEKSLYWLHYHDAVTYDRLNVIQWLWEIGLNFDGSVPLEEVTWNEIMTVCQKVLLDLSNRTIEWLAQQTSFNRFFDEPDRLKCSLFFRDKTASDATKICRRLRLLAKLNITLDEFHPYVESTMVSIASMSVCPKNFSFHIFRLQNSSEWLFFIRYFHHQKRLSFSGHIYNTWKVFDRPILMTPIIFFCETVLNSITGRFKYASTFVKWFYYNVFAPYVLETFPGFKIDRILIPIPKNSVPTISLHEHFFPILIKLYGISGYEYLEEDLVTHLSQYAVLASSRELLEYYAQFKYFNYYKIIPFAVHSGDTDVVKILLDMNPSMRDYTIGYLNSAMHPTRLSGEGVEKVFWGLSQEDYGGNLCDLKILSGDYSLNMQ